MKKLNFAWNAFRIVGIASTFALSAGVGLAYANYDLSSINDTTGSHSENTNVVNSNKCIDLIITDTARYTNTSSNQIETGYNDGEHNTMIGPLETGEINAQILIQNPSSLSDCGICFGDCNNSCFGFNDVEFESTNHLTGCDSINTNTLNLDRHASVTYNNNACIKNDLDIHASTGNNTVSCNTTAAGISTGDIDIDARIDNSESSGCSYIDLGELAGQGEVCANFGNGLTGANSINTNVLNANTDLHATINNNTQVTNDVSICANTGHNQINNNTTAGGLSTGDISLRVGINN